MNPIDPVVNDDGFHTDASLITDRGPEYCVRMERHDYQPCLAVNNVEHTKTKTETKSPQTNGICERFHKTVLQEFYQVAFRKKLYSTLEELHRVLDDWLMY
jgi:putative transposase